MRCLSAFFILFLVLAVAGRPIDGAVAGGGEWLSSALVGPDEPFSLEIRHRPFPVRAGRDVIARLVLEYPAAMQVNLPDLTGRFAGLSALGMYREVDDKVDADMVREIFHYRLRPDPEADAYRLAPFALSVGDAAADQVRRWVITRPHFFASIPLPSPSADPGLIEHPLDISPVWSRRLLDILPFIALVPLIGAGGWLIWRRRRRPVPGPCPAATALRQLALLAGRDYPGQQLYREFYVELTLIVRRYIELAHGIQAPEQTTPEFLAAAASHQAFDRPTLALLRSFLEAADLVKFAAHPAGREAAATAMATARSYIEADSGVVRQREEAVS